MYGGLDFGTSSCSIGISAHDKPTLLPLEGESVRLPSAMYTIRPSVETEEIDELELKNRVNKAKIDQARKAEAAKNKNEEIKKLSDAAIESRERGLMRRESAERAYQKYSNQSISEALFANTEDYFGEEAIRLHLKDAHSGYFVKSPKSFIGSQLKREDIELFSEVITRILAHIKYTAEGKIGKEIKDVVLGRPVNFHGARGLLGNKQAISILERSAIAAGFNEIEFLMEPIAAALDFERHVSKELVALVLDAGGGTTDCSMVRLGSARGKSEDRSKDVLGYAGDRVGGSDLDMKLALRKIMPHFGKDSLLKSGLPVPANLFWKAVAVNNVNAQREFLGENTGEEIARYIAQSADKNKLRRLQVLHDGKLSFRLSRSAELAKIYLSDRDLINLPLRYIEEDFVIPISRADLSDAIERELGTFVSLMKEAERQAGAAPDVVYVTGGTAKSPVVEEWIRSNYRDIDLVLGDFYESVTAGLATWAGRIFA